MAETSALPYVTAYGNITKGLDKIQVAAVPPRFTQDFLQDTLAMKGGSARPLIPFLKRTGFLNSDGTPTERYKRFRNSAQRGAAAAAALRQGYAPLYQIDEKAHELTPGNLRGNIIQVTGMDAENSAVRAIQGSFKALAAYADFSEDGAEPSPPPPDQTVIEQPPLPPPPPLADDGDEIPRLALGYTINLHLPPTSDIAVFDAIFKSLREHILRKP